MPTSAELKRERELINRKQEFKATYKKKLFLPDKEWLCKKIMQSEVLVRVHTSGALNDGTAFINVTVEGIDNAMF